MSDLPFADQHVVITGGGTGMGRATALAFAGLGAAGVIITGRRENRLAEVAALDPVIVPVRADVTTEDGAEAVAAAVAERGGKLDVLVHNAGVYRMTPVDGFDIALAREMLETNVVGPVLLTTRLLPMLRSPGGNIVIVSSVAGHNPEPQASVYAASKAGLHSLTLTWARELAGRGIRVNAVAPSAIRTEVFATNGFSDDDVNALFAKFKSINPLGRTGTVDDVTPWITKLADPSSSWVTGQIVTIDGGVDLTSANDSLFLAWDDSSWGEDSGSLGTNAEA